MVTANQQPWVEGALADAWPEAMRMYEDYKRVKSFEKYQADPVGFVEDVLGEYVTEDCKAIMRSVLDRPVTLAKSANGPGKSWSAARIAVWFYLVFDDAKVYLTAAPPEDNIRKVLWGELMGIVGKHPNLFANHVVRSRDIYRHSESFITRVTIPQSGTSETRISKFCADIDDEFELLDGSVVRYGDLIGRENVAVTSVDERLEQKVSTAEFFDNGVQDVYLVEFEDGSRISRTGNHPLYSGWDILPTKKSPCRVVHSKGWVDVSALSKDFAVLCPDSTEFNFGDQELADDLVKFMGYMIGDGCFVAKSERSNTLQFTQERNAQYAEFREIVDRCGARYTVSDIPEYNWACVSINDARLANFVKDSGLYGHRSGEKFVPDVINSLPREKLAMFLNRLFSTDGWAGVYRVGQKYHRGEIGYSSKSELLIRDVQRLLLRFGIRAKVRPRRVKKYGIHWSLTIWDSYDIVRFADEIGIYGKEQGVQDCLKYAKSRRWRYANWKYSEPGYRWKKIKSVTMVGKRPTVGVSVPGDNTYLTSVVEHNSGKHSPHLMFAVDEGDGVPDEVFKGIEGCMSGGMARLLVMFNPKLQSGSLYHMEQNGLANVVKLSAFTHPNVVTGEDVVPGAVSREITVRRINDWTRPLVADEPPDASCFELPDFLVGATALSTKGTAYLPLQGGWRKITSPEFSYMVLGEYPTQSESQLINKAWIDAARQRWDLYVAQYGEVPTAGVKPILGLDVAEMGADYNIICLRYGGFVPKFVHLWNGLDTDLTARRTLDVYRKSNTYIAMIDGTGIGSSVAPFMAREGRLDSDPVRAISVKVANAPSPLIKTDLGEFDRLRDQLYWALMLWLRDDNTAMLPPDQYLIDELMAIQYEVNLRGKIKITDKKKLRTVLRRSPDRADALALTFAPYERPKVMRLMD